MDFSLNSTLKIISDISARGDYPFTLFFSFWQVKQ